MMMQKKAKAAVQLTANMVTKIMGEIAIKTKKTE